MTRERKCRMHVARAAEGAAEYAWASQEWEEVRTADGAAEAGTKAIKTASECRNS